MHPEQDYYQISGYRAHSNGWFKMYDDKPMVAAIMATKTELFRPGGQDTPVEFILGILPNGASYLLMTSEQMHQFTLKHRLTIPRDPWRATDFESLSPIYFNSIEELSAKIGTYKQRPRNKNRREHEKPQDNSQANRGYVQVGANVVHFRGYFEQQRTLYSLLNGDLDPSKVGMAPPPWLQGVRVISLVFEEWAADGRSRSVRVKEPDLIDIGWTTVLFPAFFGQLTATSTVHFKLKTLRKNPCRRNPFLSNVVEGDQAELYSRLRKLFNPEQDRDNGSPVIVLVHNEEVALSVLSHAGINTPFSSGLSTLLALAPARRSKVEPHIPKPGSKTCFVDMQKLVKTLMETNPGVTVPQSATVLHMQTDTKTCAGDDSLLQLCMWTSMAEGLPIDEQRKQRASRQPDCAQVLAPPPGQADAEKDPNDMSGSEDSNDRLPIPRPMAEDDFSDEDDW